MHIRTMEGPFGAIADGVDLSRPLVGSEVRQLIDALHRHQILVLPEQKIDDVQFLAFGNNWGRPLDFFIDSHRNQQVPQVIEIANRASTPERYRDGAVHWHSDSSYEDEPASVTMLYCLEAPDLGGETLFASAVLAYEALDADTRAEIDDLVGLHCLGGSPPVEGEKIPMIAEATARHGIKTHPLVMRHPVTGRKALFTSATAFGAKGYGTGDEGRELIAKLRRHMLRDPFVTSYKAKAGDVVLWDNFQVLHSATPIEYSDEDGKRRIMRRISTKGLPALCEAEAA